MISVITATYQNGPELENAITTMGMQTFKDWQHVIVSDGPDPQLRTRMKELGYEAEGKRVFLELGRNWHGFMGGDGIPTPEGRPGDRGGRGSRGSMAVLAATFLTSGDYIGYLDADCLFFPNHLEVAADGLAEGVDFVYTRVHRVVDGKTLDLIGSSPPSHGKIDGNGMVHSAELLKIANWRWGGDSDYDLISRWIEAGATYKLLPVMTVQWNHTRSDM